MDRNKMLLDFASDWTLDGDLLRCRDCKRAQIASRQDEDFVHRSDCKKLRISGRPWSVLQAILLTLPSGVSVVDQLAAVTAQRDELVKAVLKWGWICALRDDATDGRVRRMIEERGEAVNLDAIEKAPAIARAQQPQQPKEEP